MVVMPDHKTNEAPAKGNLLWGIVYSLDCQKTKNDGKPPLVTLKFFLGTIFRESQTETSPSENIANKKLPSKKWQTDD